MSWKEAIQRTNLITGKMICAIPILGLILSGVSCSKAIPAHENTVITFSTNNIIRSLYPSLEALVEEFHRQNLSITVKFVNHPVDAWNRDDLNSLASAADVTLLFYNRERLAHNYRYFRDMAPLMGTNRTFQADDFWPGLLDSCKDVEGHILGIPLSVVFTGIYYDPSVFDAAGLSYPAPSWMWNDFQRDITAIAFANEDQVDYGFVDSTGFFTSILASQIDGFPSDGEWQKIALARLFMREADLLIQDEPTAALDAQAEYDLFCRFVELVHGRTSLLISHRFSTVRMADRIAVLENGLVTECGMHAELIAQGGAMHAGIRCRWSAIVEGSRPCGNPQDECCGNPQFTWPMKLGIKRIVKS